MPTSECRDFSDETEVEEFKSIAQRVFNLRFGEGDKFTAGYNMLGIRSEHVVFCRRLDSRTYFIQDYRHGVGRPLGVFRGDDQDQLNICRDILRNLDIPISEIAHEVVLREKNQVAQFDRVGKAMKFEDAQEGGSYVHISRQIGGMSVLVLKSLAIPSFFEIKESDGARMLSEKNRISFFRSPRCLQT